MPFKNAELLTETCCRETKHVFSRKLLGFDKKKKIKERNTRREEAKAPGNELVCAVWDSSQVSSLLVNLLMGTF